MLRKPTSTSTVNRPASDRERNTAPVRVWCVRGNGPEPVNALAEVVIRSVDPWVSWLTCTEMDPEGLCGRRVARKPGADEQ